MATLSQHQIYVFATSFMAAFFVAAIVRLWLLRRVEEKLLKNKDALEKQIVLQQKDLMTVRKESNDWRMEMQRQFDLFRHMASDQLGVEEKRFNDLLAKSTRREYELQTALDLAKQMCAELPSAKARVLHLESLLGSAPPAPAIPPAPQEPDSGSDSEGGLPVSPVTPMPDLSGGSAPVPPPAPVEEETLVAEEPAPAPPPAPIFPPKVSIPSPLASLVTPVAAAPVVSLPPPTTAPTALVDETKLSELEEKLAEAEKKNASLQLALTTTRLRSRSKTKSHRKYTTKKRELMRA